MARYRVNWKFRDWSGLSRKQTTIEAKNKKSAKNKFLSERPLKEYLGDRITKIEKVGR